MREVAPGGALLPGLLVGDVRQGARGPAERDDAVLPALARTASRRPTATSSRSTTASPTTFLPAPGYFSTTNAWSTSTPLIVRENGIVACKHAGGPRAAAAQGPERPDVHARRPARDLGRRGLDADRARSPRRGAARPTRTIDLLSVEARGGVVERDRAPPHARRRTRAGRRRATLEDGDRAGARATSLPEPPPWTVLTTEMAELLGLLAADGCVSRETGHDATSRTTTSACARGSRSSGRAASSARRDSWLGRSGFDPDATRSSTLNLTGADALGALAARAALHARRLQAGPAAGPQRRRATSTTRSSTATTPATG